MYKEYIGQPESEIPSLLLSHASSVKNMDTFKMYHQVNFIQL